MKTCNNGMRFMSWLLPGMLSLCAVLWCACGGTNGSMEEEDALTVNVQLTPVDLASSNPGLKLALFANVQTDSAAGLFSLTSSTEKIVSDFQVDLASLGIMPGICSRDMSKSLRVEVILFQFVQKAV